MTQRNAIETHIKQIVLEYFKNKIPERIDRLAGIATMDLYFGPYSASDLEGDGDDIYTSFSQAIDEIKDWIDINVPSDLYVDLDCDYVQESEPQGYTDEETGEYIEPFLESIYHLKSRREIMGAIWNKEIISYL